MPKPSAQMPKHVAIVMDGNGRWAKQRGRARTFGHHRGARSARRAIEFCARNDIPNLTLFAFSSENWSRPAEEVGMLMKLFLRALRTEIKELKEHGVKLRFIGDTTRFSGPLQEAMREGTAETAGGTKLCLNVAVNYGGRWDLVQAAQKVAKQVELGQLKADQVTESTFAAHLTLADIPEPDLFIRTSGESRISNFLLWQLAYTELYFTPLLWPDFDESAFDQAIAAFQGRERRFGLISEQLEALEGA